MIENEKLVFARTYNVVLVRDTGKGVSSASSCMVVSGFCVIHIAICGLVGTKTDEKPLLCQDNNQSALDVPAFPKCE